MVNTWEGFDPALVQFDEHGEVGEIGANRFGVLGKTSGFSKLGEFGETGGKTEEVISSQVRLLGKNG